MLLLKIGGGRGINIDGIAEDLATLSRPVVVVHGANAWRDELAGKLGVTMEVVTSVRGYDSVLSTEQTMDVMLMSYAGLRNKRLVESFLRHGIPAVGLTGLDGRAVKGKRNPGIQCRMGDKLILRRDLSGKPKSTNAQLLDSSPATAMCRCLRYLFVTSRDLRSARTMTTSLQPCTPTFTQPPLSACWKHRGSSRTHPMRRQSCSG